MLQTLSKPLTAMTKKAANAVAAYTPMKKAKKEQTEDTAETGAPSLKVDTSVATTVVVSNVAKGTQKEQGKDTTQGGETASEEESAVPAAPSATEKDTTEKGQTTPKDDIRRGFGKAHDDLFECNQECTYENALVVFFVRIMFSHLRMRCSTLI